jgi:hypothetical protein
MPHWTKGGLQPTRQAFGITHLILLAFPGDFGSFHVGYVFEAYLD